MSLKFPRECIPFTAFYKTMPPLESSLRSAAVDWLNDDDVFAPVDLMFRHEPTGVHGLDSSGEVTTRRSKHLGDYLVTFRYAYRRDLDVIA